MLWVSIVLASTLTGLATAQSSSWTVNFYSSPDCSAESLTSTYTGTDFYTEYKVSPPGQYLTVTKTGDASYQGALVSSDPGATFVMALVGQGCVKGPVGGATLFQIV
ncbi:uncharacterized protein TrAFT101_011954 [Trichoderma asperellum]|uniref:uncharacterized protein n=1 Tax=Trichoderma asperellum TaxID=101201 RepID=UPI00331A9765|nr:hypothetical protein TrAFT101_011954 [Trichoderma asperellum]